MGKEKNVKTPFEITFPEVNRHPLGFFRLNDIPDQRELEEYYSKKYYQTEKGNYRSKYPEKELDYIRAKIHQKFSFIRKNFNEGTEHSMLDIGCGEGFALNYFHKIGWKVKGVDFSDYGCKTMNPEMINYLITGDVYSLLEEILLKNEKFDVLWLSNVLEHVPDPVLLMNRIGGLLKENGILITVVPNDFSILQKRLLAEQCISKPFWIAKPDHISYFDAKGLETIANHTGWNSLGIIADFPIDWFLADPDSNYVDDSTKGSGAHKARVDVELIIADNDVDKVNRFYQSMAEIGMGRQLTGFFKRKNDEGI